MRASLLVFAIATQALLGACTRRPQLDEAPSKAETASSSGASTHAVSYPLDSKTIGWQLGKRYYYKMSMTSQIGLGEQSQLHDFDLTGMVVVTPVAVESEVATVFLTIEGGRFESRVPNTQQEFDSITNELKRPYFFELKGGLVRTANLPKETHPMVAAVFRTISASLQFAHPSTPREDYSATEYDTTGQYLAEYKRKANARTWEKHKRKYLGILLAQPLTTEAKEIAPQILQSSADVELSSDGRPRSIAARDELVLTNAQAPLKSKTTLSLVESAVETGQPVDAIAALRAGTISVAAHMPFESELDRKNLDSAKINGWTFDKLLITYEQIAARSSGVSKDPNAKRAQLKAKADEESKLFFALGAILRNQPEAVNQALKRIASKSPISDTLIDGLGAANSDGAQKALIKLAKDQHGDRLIRTRALLSLSRVEHPTKDATHALLSLMDDELLGTQATYGIGSFTRQYAFDGNRANATVLGDILVARLGKAKSELRIMEGLRAIANAGYTPALDAVRPFLTDPRPQVRADAIHALGAMDSVEIDAILVRKLTEDSDKKVRLAIIDTMGQRAPNDMLIASLRENLGADDPHVRYRAVELMIRWLPKRQELRDNISAVALNDEEEKIRELARAAL